MKNKPFLKTFKVIVLITVLLIAWFLNTPAASANQPYVILDPGHGGADSGSPNGELAQLCGVPYGEDEIMEKDITLAVAQLVRGKLTAGGIQVEMTRTGDISKSLTERVNFINTKQPDLVVSIHTNSGNIQKDENGNVISYSCGEGVEAWYSSKLSSGASNPNLEVSQNLAHNLALQINEKFGLTLRRNNGIEDAINHPLGCLALVCGPTVPSALIEMAFISNPTERQLMLDRQEEFAQVIASAIFEQLGITSKNETFVNNVSDPDAYSCSQSGYVDFEEFDNGVNLSSGTIAGMQFTTTNGYSWLVGDFATGNYNGKYPNGGYTSQGTHWAWLGITQGAGKIDFPEGPASYFSLLTSNNTSVFVDAYSASGEKLATAGPASSNYNTGHMTELKITRATADMAYVLVHDTGNYFEIDSVCTNAPGTPNTINRVVDQTYYMQTGQRVTGNFFLDFIFGFWRYLRIFIGPFHSDVDLILTRPDGTIVSPDDPGVTFTKTGNYVEVIIEGADSGEWNYEIIANELDPGGENIRIAVDEQLIVSENEPPSLTVPSNQKVHYNDPLSFNVSATDLDDASSTLVFSATGLPNDLTLTNNEDGTATVSGVVNVAPGTYTAKITVTDPGGLSDTKPITIEVVYSVPTLPILDDFNRADGLLGANWLANKFRYRILNNQLIVRYSGTVTDMYWKTPFGADQEAYVTFAKINENADEQNLLLKAQSSRTWGDGVLEVLYNPQHKIVQVWTWEWPKGWVQHGDDILITFVDGDTFGARARPDGIVEIYRNGELIGTRDVTSWRFYDKGGYIGLWFLGAKGAILDDFGGGTVPEFP